MPLPKLITGEFQQKIPSSIFTSNPCRIQYCTQEIVVIREDLVTKMCRNTIHFPTSGEIPEHVSIKSLVMIKGIVKYTIIHHSKYLTSNNFTKHCGTYLTGRPVFRNLLVYSSIGVISFLCYTVKPLSIVSEGTMTSKWWMRENDSCGQCTGTSENEQYLCENNACGNNG
jgi:hypothetical protein